MLQRDKGQGIEDKSRRERMREKGEVSKRQRERTFVLKERKGCLRVEETHFAHRKMVVYKTT